MSKEKQIEEIVKILLMDCEGACTDCEYYGRYDGSLCIPVRLANIFYNAGYRKQSVGEWESFPSLGTAYRCSVCKEKAENKSKFCPNCGAKMKGGAE